MSGEKVKERVDEAVELVVASGMDIDEALVKFERATERLEEVRAMREGSR